MANRASQKRVTFEPDHVIEPIYTGGSVSLSKDGRILATCMGEDVRLTDLLTGSRLIKLEGDGETVTTLTLTPSASHLVVCSRSQSMRIYNLERPTDGDTVRLDLVRTLKPHASPVITCSVDKSGTLLATGGADGLVKVWDIRGGYTTHTLHGHSGVVSALCFFEVGTTQDQEASNGFRLASGSEDGQVRIWDLQRRRCAAVLQSHVSVVRALDYNQKFNVLLSGSRDKTVIIWNANTWTIRNTIPILEGVEAARFFDALPFVCTGGEAGKLKLWNHETGQEITDQQVKEEEGEGEGQGEAIVDILSNGDLSLFVTIHADQIIKMYSNNDMRGIHSLRLTQQISGSHDDIIDLAHVGPKKEYLAVATNLEQVRILSLDTGRSSYFGEDVGSLRGHKDIVICMDVDRSGYWIATGAKDNTARLWRMDAEKESFSCWATFTGHAESLGAISLSKEDFSSWDQIRHPSFVITGSQDRTIKKWNISSEDSKPKAAYTRKAHDKDVNAIDINHKSSLFASASQDRTVKIWSVEDGEAVGVLRGHKRGVWSIKFAPQDTPPVLGESGQSSSAKGLVLTSSGDKTVKIWTLSDYSCIRTFEGHTNSVLKVLWMPLENSSTGDKPKVQIASAGGDGLVKVWDANTGELDCTLDNHTDRVWALASHPETRTIISGGGDGVITFWKDTTNTTSAQVAAANTARVEQDQQLQNYIRSGSYREAITLALQLDHPQRLLSLFTLAVNTFPPEKGSICGVKAVDEVIGTLSNEQLLALLLRIRDWNTNVKTSVVAQKVLWTLLQSYPPSTFVKLKTLPGTSQVKQVLDAVKVYTERHYRRVEDLIDESYLLDYTLGEMDDGVSELTPPWSANGPRD